MEKLFKICCVAGLGVSLLFVSACNEQPDPGPKQTSQPQVVSKAIPEFASGPKTKAPVREDAGKKQVPPSPGPEPAREADNAGGAGDTTTTTTTTTADDGGDTGLQKEGIRAPIEKYDIKDRVDPFIPLIAEKNASIESGSSGDTKSKRTLTPLEKLELSQVKLVAVVEMPGRTIAMVEEASGKGYEVGLGTYIGPDSGRVVSITREGIKIEKKVKDFKGQLSKRYEEIKFHKSEDEK